MWLMTISLSSTSLSSTKVFGNQKQICSGMGCLYTGEGGYAVSMPHRLAIFHTHPIQYFAPLWRFLAASPGLDVVVHYLSDQSVRGAVDPGFAVPVAWDTPVTEGYQHRFITRDADLSRPRTVSIPNVEQLLRDGGFDTVLVHGYNYRFCRQVVRAAAALKIGVILRGEFTDVAPPDGRSKAKILLRNLYLRWFYRHVDAFCYIGEEARLHLVRRGISPNRMFFSPYCVDTELFTRERNKFARQEVRAELGIGSEQLVIAFSGKLIPRKAPILLLQAIAKLPDLSKITLIMVGEGPLRAQVESLGRAILGERFRVTGFVNQTQVGKYYAASDVFVLPSTYDTWGLVVNEAMIFGLPAVVSTNVGCRRDLVMEGETGYSFHNGDADDLARCLARFQADPQLASRMGHQAAKRVAQYSISNSGAGILQAIGAVTDKGQLA